MLAKMRIRLAKKIQDPGHENRDKVMTITELHAMKIEILKGQVVRLQGLLAKDAASVVEVEEAQIAVIDAQIEAAKDCK